MSQLPWGSKMRRIHAEAEWMAPEEVVQQVRLHYLEALNWLHDSMFESWAAQWSDASAFLNGAFLKRHQQELLSSRDASLPAVVGVLRCDHTVEVRHFSEHGDDCLVVDHQMGRRMATYNREAQERVHTQDLGDGSVVYRMRYDARSRRWKIDQFIQELPAGWVNARRQLREIGSLPPNFGRDS
jgi:hypothetical protein